MAPATADELPVAISVGTQVLGAWCGFSLGYTALQTVIASDLIGFLGACVLGLAAGISMRRSVATSPPRTQLILFGILSGIAFLTLVIPLPLPFTSPAS